MLCCDVFIFLVKQGVPCDEDFECLYPSCLLNGKRFFRAFLSIANKRYKWCVTKSDYVAMTNFLTGRKKQKEVICCSSDALTLKKRKTRLAGTTRTYLWACPLTPTPKTHLPFPCFCKIKVRGSSKMA